MTETPFSSGAATAAGTTAIRPPQAPPTTYASLARDAGLLRDRVQLTQTDVAQLHRTSQLGLLDERTAIVAVQDADELLATLADYGLSWSTIARLLGVSDTAVRKWRKGESIGPESRRRLARVAAFLEMLQQAYAVAEVGSWLEMRISDDAVVTPTDIYADGRADLLFELVGRRMAPHHVLDAFDPDWRLNRGADSKFSVVVAPDGDLAISERRPRSADATQ